MNDAIVPRVIDRLSDFVKQGNALGLKADFKSLKEDLSKIQCLLPSDADVCLREEGIAILTKRLDGVAYEISGLLKELRMVTVKSEGSLFKKVRSLIPYPSCSSPCFAEAPLRSHFAFKVSVCSLTLRTLFEKTKNFQSKLAPSLYNPLPAVFDKKRVLKHLLDIRNRNKVEVMSIVGFTGSGKTTLARSLYCDDSVKQHFDIQGWAYMPETYNETDIAAQLLGSSGTPNTGQSVLELLEEYISGKKVLLVLDDVWGEDVLQWDTLKNSLWKSAFGSKILVTTRSQSVASELRSDFVHGSLGRASYNECWLLISHVLAWKGRYEIPREMMKIGKKIAKKCEGSLQIATAAGMKLLDAHTPQDWQTVLDTAEIWQTVLDTAERWQMEKKTVSLHDLYYMTYDELSPESKLCFCYCALFPIERVIYVDQLIRLWMAEGYLGYPTTKASDEVIQAKGVECLIELQEHCLLKILGTDSIHKNDISSCRIPTPAHQFIKSMVNRYSVDKLWQSSLSFSKSEVPKDLFTHMKYLTALVLSSCHLEQLPKWPEDLNLLQYLDLSRNPLKELPAKICKLSSLQFIDVSFCYLLSHLPQQIGEVASLKHLRVNFTADELHTLPQGFENLTLLQTLDVVRVGGKYDSNVQKLGGLNQLEDIRLAVHGRVHFSGADLKNKAEMKNMELCFVGEGRDQEMEKYIELLEPPPNLQMLKIDDYPGLSLPEWITYSLMSKLKRLSVRSASNISSFPSLWKMSCLEFLWLYDIPGVKRLGREFFGFSKTGDDHSLRQRYSSESSSSDDSERGEDDEQIGDGDTAFPCLKTLRIEYLQNWETWEDIDEIDEKSIKVMPSLEEIIIDGCPNFHAKPLPLRILKYTPWYVIHGERRNMNPHTNDKPSTSRGKANEIE